MGYHGNGGQTIEPHRRVLSSRRGASRKPMVQRKTHYRCVGHQPHSPDPRFVCPERNQQKMPAHLRSFVQVSIRTFGNSKTFAQTYGPAGHCVCTCSVFAGRWMISSRSFFCLRSKYGWIKSRRTRAQRYARRACMGLSRSQTETQEKETLNVT